jgi:endonuclease/exonuclease/phosphatase (EEP) superfamily protein YafD
MHSPVASKRTRGVNLTEVRHLKLAAFIVAFAVLSIVCAVQAQERDGKHSIVIVSFGDKRVAAEIVPDGEVGEFKELVVGEYEKAVKAWKSEADEPKPEKPQFRVYKEGLSRQRAEEEVKKLRSVLDRDKALDDWRDAYAKRAEPVSKSGLRKPEKPKGKHVTVLTYNVNYALPKSGESVKAILESKADVVFLQETNRKWEKLLKREMKKNYPHSLFRHPGGKYKAAGLAVFSKHELKELKYIKSKIGWFPACLYEVNLPVGKMHVLNLHLKPVTSEKGRFDLDALKKTMEKHVEEIQHFYPSEDKDKPIFILGDFNEPCQGDAVKWLQERGYKNALPEFDATTPTWSGKVHGMKLEQQVDHIFYSKKLHCCEAKVIKKGGSDHNPVLAVFEVQQDKPDK